MIHPPFPLREERVHPIEFRRLLLDFHLGRWLLLRLQLDPKTWQINETHIQKQMHNKILKSINQNELTIYKSYKH